MNYPNGFSQKTVTLESRSFFLRIQKFDNGFFVSVTEGANKIGSMVASMATGPVPITTTIIPSKSEFLFLKLTAERISTRIHGIALVSAYFQNEVKHDTTKTLMSEIVEMIDNE